MKNTDDPGYAINVGADVTYCDSCKRLVYVGLKGYKTDPEDLAAAMDRHLMQYHIHEPDIINVED